MRTLVIFIFLSFFYENESQRFCPKLNALGNILISLCGHLFARLTGTLIEPTGEENILQQLEYIRDRLKDFKAFVYDDPIPVVKANIIPLNQSFNYQVVEMFRKVYFETEELRDTYNLTAQQIKQFFAVQEEMRRMIKEMNSVKIEKFADENLGHLNFQLKPPGAVEAGNEYC